MSDRQTGPILLRTGEFEMLTTADFADGPSGPIVVPRTSPAWLATGAAVLAGGAVCLVLALDRNEKAGDSARHKLAYTAAETELTRAQAELTATAEILHGLHADRAELNALRNVERTAQVQAGTLEGVARAMLDKDIRNGDVRVARHGARVEVTVQAWALLDVENLDITPRGIDLLVRIAQVLKETDRTVRVVVHSDDVVPTKLKDRAASPWDLSAAEAALITRFLVEQGELHSARFEAVGRGASEPLVPNNGPKNRAHNRRVVFSVDAH